MFYYRQFKADPPTQQQMDTLLILLPQYSDNDIRHKQFFNSSPPQFPCTEIPSIPDFHTSHGLLIFIIFLIFPATASVFNV